MSSLLSYNIFIAQWSSEKHNWPIYRYVYVSNNGMVNDGQTIQTLKLQSETYTSCIRQRIRLLQPSCNVYNSFLVM